MHVFYINTDAGVAWPTVEKVLTPALLAHTTFIAMKLLLRNVVVIQATDLAEILAKKGLAALTFTVSTRGLLQEAKVAFDMRHIHLIKRMRYLAFVTLLTTTCRR